MKAIINKPDGSVEVIIPAPGVDIKQAVTKSNTMGYPYIIVNDDVFPSDRTWRNAWSLVDSKIEIDRTKAEKIHMDRLRHLRNEQLKNLDVKVLKAMETKDTQKEVELVGLKQELRDMPTTYDLAPIPLENLHKAKPTYLEGDIESLKTKVFSALS